MEKYAHSFSCSSGAAVSNCATQHTFPISVNTAVELLSRDTELIHNHKVHYLRVLKPCRLNV